MGKKMKNVTKTTTTTTTTTTRMVMAKRKQGRISSQIKYWYCASALSPTLHNAKYTLNTRWASK